MLLKKEREHMDTIKLEMTLKLNSSNEEVLECLVDGVTYSLNFASDNQNSLRKFFLVVLNKAKTCDLEFDYKKDSSFNNAIFETVSQEYIAGLNSEIKSIREEIMNIGSKEDKNEVASSI